MLIDTNCKEAVDGGSGYMDVDFRNIFFNFLNEHNYNVCTLLCNFIEVTLLHECSPVNLLQHLFLRTPLGGCFWINQRHMLQCSFVIHKKGMTTWIPLFWSLDLYLCYIFINAFDAYFFKFWLHLLFKNSFGKQFCEQNQGNSSGNGREL